MMKKYNEKIEDKKLQNSSRIKNNKKIMKTKKIQGFSPVFKIIQTTVIPGLFKAKSGYYLLSEVP